jgi:hypothetical protein
MGLFSSLQSLGYKAYNGLKKIGHGFGSAIHKVAGATNFIDGILDDLSGLPVIGNISDEIRNNTIYQTVLEGVQTVDEAVSFVEDVGVGNAIDFTTGILVSPIF